MSQRVLKTELSILEKNFPRNNGCFQIIIASLEELACRFVDTKGNKYNLQCNISVSNSSSRDFENMRIRYGRLSLYSPAIPWSCPFGPLTVMTHFWYS